MKNIILSIDRIEPGLVRACRKISRQLGVQVKGISLVDKSFKETTDYLADSTGVFEEIVCDFNDADELAKILEPIKDQILAVQCRIETGVQDLAKVVPFLQDSVPVPTPKALEAATVKSLMREKMRAYDENLVPKFRPIHEDQLESLEEIIANMDFPLIVKPSGLNSSILVTKCEDIDSLKETLKRSFAVLHEIYEKERGSGEPELLIEEFMVGDMYSTDAYVTPNGEVLCLPPVKVITSHEVGLSGFYGYEFQIPDGLNLEELHGLYQTATASVKALQLTSCTAHIELYNCRGKWKIIELGPRIGGHREDLYREGYDVDHHYNDLASRIEGLQPVMPTGLIKYAICMDLYPKHEGVISGFDGFEAARELATCVHAKEHTAIGEPFYSAENGSPYAADALFSGKDHAQVVADAARARELIRINTLPLKK